MSFGDRLRSFAIFLLSAVAPHGGISRATTLFLIARAHGRAFWYVMSDIGATSPGRWQTTQFLYRIGATSLVNVGASAACASEASARNVTATASVF